MGATGSQFATTTVPATAFYTGGAFTMARDSGTTNITSIMVTASGTLNANAYLGNLSLYYQAATTCATSSIPAGATLFNATGGSFNASEQATVTGTMPVGTANVCIYAQVNIASSSPAGQTFELTIANPSTDVTVGAGTVSPAAGVGLGGFTTMPSATLTQQDFQIYKNINAVQPTSSLAAQDAAATGTVSGEVVRVVMNIEVGGAALPSSTQSFKLQYAPKGTAASCSAVPSANFADVGAFGSSAPWRGYSNASTTDGTTLTATLLSSSTVPESYIEQNPSPANPNPIPANGTGEWDFVVQDNDAPSGAAYCFRMMTGAGASLDGYVNYPEVDTVPSATWRAAETTPTSTTEDTSVRLRMEFSNNGNTAASAAFRLEYATSTAGPWTPVPVDPTCSTIAAAFRECPSGYFADLDPTHSLLTPAAATFVSGFMLESTTPSPVIAINTNQFTELEWNIQATEGATFGQTYYFRATNNGASIGTYSVYPQINVVAASSTFAENYYRWYVNTNALTPTAAWPAGTSTLGENMAITAADSPPTSGSVLRLRMAVTLGGAVLPTSTQAFKLQYGVMTTSCSAISSWSDVGAIGGAGPWNGYANAGVTNGTPLTTLLLSVSNRDGVYADANPSAANPYRSLIGDNIEYDWVLQYNSTSSSASYCFRMAKSDGTPLDSYVYYPAVTTAPFNPESANWRFYSDANDETPVIPLAGENVAPSTVENGSTIKLRVAVAETNNVSGSNVKFALQYSTYSNFSSGVGSVAEVGSCTSSSQWCYATSTGGTDNAVISTAVLSDSSACTSGVGPGCGTHNTSGISSSTFTQQAGAVTEYEFTIVGNGATTNATYFFRLVNNGTGSPVALYGTSSYPSLAVEGALLTFTVSGMPQGTSTDGIVTTASSTPAGISFGTLTIATSSMAAQQLLISTDAPNGFELYALQDAPLMNGRGYVLPGVDATNGSPLPWSSACTATSTACYGYHPGSPVLSGGSTRFAADDSYAALTSTPAEIGYSGGPATSTINVVYRVQAGPTQVNGNYNDNVIYIATPVF